MIIAGSERYPGAACLATRAAQRMGAGYVECFTSSPLARQLMLSACPSAVVHLLDELCLESMSEDKPGHPRSLCIGPGFDSQDEQSARVVIEALKKASCPVLIDGGALAFLDGKRARKALEKRSARNLTTLVTPHGGEAARLAKSFGVDAKDPNQLALALSETLGATVVLKGPDTYIASGRSVHCIREGTAALAKAGTGDVLAGMIGSLLAQGVSASDAALLGSTLHARAGVSASQQYTLISVTPEDVIEHIPNAITSLKQG